MATPISSGDNDFDTSILEEPSINDSVTLQHPTDPNEWEDFPWRKFQGYIINLSKKRLSWVWDYSYDIVHAKDGSARWVCKECVRKDYKVPESYIPAGIDNIKRHLIKEHKIKDTRASQAPTRSSTPQSRLSQAGLDASIPSYQRRINDRLSRFDYQHFQRLLTNWVADDNIAFRKLESQAFRKLIAYINPLIKEMECIPTYLTMRKWLQSEYLSYKGVITEAIQEAFSQVHIIFNGWTSRRLYSFLSIIVDYYSIHRGHMHFLIAMPCLEGSHTGKNLAEEVLSVINEYNFSKKIGYMMLDNVLNNNTAVEAIAKEL